MTTGDRAWIHLPLSFPQLAENTSTVRPGATSRHALQLNGDFAEHIAFYHLGKSLRSGYPDREYGINRRMQIGTFHKAQQTSKTSHAEPMVLLPCTRMSWKNKRVSSAPG